MNILYTSIVYIDAHTSVSDFFFFSVALLFLYKEEDHVFYLINPS